MRLLVLSLALLSTLAFAEQITIDWDRAKALHQRVSNGETLSADDQKYYETAKREFDAGRGPGGGGGSPEANAEMQRAKAIYDRKQAGQSVTPDEEKFLAEMMKKRGDGGSAAGDTEEVRRAKDIQRRKQAGEKVSEEDEKFLAEMIRKHTGGGGQPQRQEPPPAPPTNLVPLTELTGTYQGQDGGLYGGGKNEPSPELAARAQKAVAQIHPLDAGGKPTPAGKIVLMSIGMSNTTQEFSTFKRLADADSRKSAQTVVVDGAQGGQTAQAWATQDRPWDEAARRIQAAGLTPAQVQVLWIKEANAGPSAGWPAETDRLRDDVRKLITRAREKYPNVRLIFLSSRIYAGYATTRLNPEPYAYEGAFAMRAVIRDQPADGPAILWGPYLWTNGEKGRALDDLKWLKEDCGGDGTHPSPSGQEKVARLLLDFFTKNPYAQPWFVRRS